MRSFDKLNALNLHLRKTHVSKTRQGADLLWEAPAIKVTWICEVTRQIKKIKSSLSLELWQLCREDVQKWFYKKLKTVIITYRSCKHFSYEVFMIDVQNRISQVISEKNNLEFDLLIEVLDESIQRPAS